MLRKFFVTSVCTTALVACVATAPAAAQTIDKETFFTFSEPVSLPGITLPAGKYEFLVDPSSEGSVVEVRSGDGMHPYGVFLVNRASASVIPDKPEVKLSEASPHMVQAIRAWWYPGEQTGYSFIYSKKQVDKLSLAD